MGASCKDLKLFAHRFGVLAEVNKERLLGITFPDTEALDKDKGMDHLDIVEVVNSCNEDSSTFDSKFNHELILLQE